MTERNPYHEPKGSPIGGQFTTGPGGSGKSQDTIVEAAREAAGLTPPGWESSRGNMEVARNFVKARNEVPERFQHVLSHSNADELIEAGAEIFLHEDGMNGFLISPEGDLQNLFSNNSKGRDTLLTAIKAGAKTLDCFDVYLPGWYAKFGFVEYKREANWTEGEPDIVYMRLEK